ncbi:hypothetical protein GMMP15_270002 [Candidatus Magnetomoraceae bacterium gMMP-15]
MKPRRKQFIIQACSIKIQNYDYGAHDRNRTGEPLPYQGSALPTELRGHKIPQFNAHIKC